MNNGTELYTLLRQYTGSEVIYKHPLVSRFNYTEGVREFSQQAGSGAYWMLDILATEPEITTHVVNHGFALVILKVTGTKAVLTVANDSGVLPFFIRDLEYTDCPEAPVFKTNPEGAWKFYIEMGYVGEGAAIICMLPQER